MKKKDSTTRQKQTRRKYDAEFKASAVQMLHSGRSVMEVSEALGINANLLRKWKSAEEPVLVATDQAEVERLRRQVRQLETERDMLKKALSIFSRTP